MANSVRSQIARSKSVKAAIVVSIFLYAVFALSKIGKRHQTTRFPWELHEDGVGEAGNGLVAVRRQPPTLMTQERTGNQTDDMPKLKVNATTKSTEPTEKCSKTIASLTRSSKWFRARYRPDVKLFMDKADISNYTAYLSHRLPYGFKGQNLTVFDQILRHENFNNPPIHGVSGKHGCVSCAVVGSGGVLNGSLAGKEIDGHDYVFRVNQAISRGRFAADVGRRTTFYTFFPESQQLEDIEDKSMIALYAMFRTYDVTYALNTMKQDKSLWTETLKKMRMPALDPGKLKIIHPGFAKYVLEAFLDNKARPTTGSIVVVAALHICDEVTIYGFGYDPKFSLHYYDSTFVKHTQKSTAAHNVQNERRLWTKLHEEGVIRLFNR